MSEVVSLDPKLRPETVAALARLFAARRGEIIDVRHDDWCGALRGQVCNCDPDIQEVL
jgi:hypothetical protein